MISQALRCRIIRRLAMTISERLGSFQITGLDCQSARFTPDSTETALDSRQEAESIQVLARTTFAIETVRVGVMLLVLLRIFLKTLRNLSPGCPMFLGGT